MKFLEHSYKMDSTLKKEMGEHEMELRQKTDGPLPSSSFFFYKLSASSLPHQNKTQKKKILLLSSPFTRESSPFSFLSIFFALSLQKFQPTPLFSRPQPFIAKIWELSRGQAVESKTVQGAKTNGV